MPPSVHCSVAACAYNEGNACTAEMVLIVGRSIVTPPGTMSLFAGCKTYVNQSSTGQPPEDRELIYLAYPHKCHGCKTCALECKEDAITFKEIVSKTDTNETGLEVKIYATIDPDKCTACGICEELCPHDAIVHSLQPKRK